MDYIMKGILFDEAIYRIDPNKWLISEKLDGQRCLYIRESGKFYSSLRHEIFVPDWWRAEVDKASADIPGDILDGELWIGRKQFDKLRSIVSRTVNRLDEEWKQIKFVCFDVLPKTCMVSVWGSEYFGRPARFRGYSDWLDRLLQARPLQNEKDNVIFSRIEMLATSNLGSLSLENILEDLVAKGAEGLILRDSKQTWIPKRGPWIMKLKPLIPVRAWVVSIEPGLRRGAIWVQGTSEAWDGMKVFKVGTGLTDEQFASLVVGQEVSVGFRELSKDNVPKESRFI
jgi:DNA ligase-1